MDEPLETLGPCQLYDGRPTSVCQRPAIATVTIDNGYKLKLCELHVRRLVDDAISRSSVRPSR